MSTLRDILSSTMEGFKDQPRDLQDQAISKLARDPEVFHAVMSNGWSGYADADPAQQHAAKMKLFGQEQTELEQQQSEALINAGLPHAPTPEEQASQLVGEEIGKSIPGIMKAPLSTVSRGASSVAQLAGMGLRAIGAEDTGKSVMNAARVGNETIQAATAPTQKPISETGISSALPDQIVEGVQRFAPELGAMSIIGPFSWMAMTGIPEISNRIEKEGGGYSPKTAIAGGALGAAIMSSPLSGIVGRFTGEMAGPEVEAAAEKFAQSGIMDKIKTVLVNGTKQAVAGAAKLGAAGAANEVYDQASVKMAQLLSRKDPDWLNWDIDRIRKTAIDMGAFGAIADGISGVVSTPGIGHESKPVELNNAIDQSPEPQPEAVPTTAPAPLSVVEPTINRFNTSDLPHDSFSQFAEQTLGRPIAPDATDLTHEDVAKLNSAMDQAEQTTTAEEKAKQTEDLTQAFNDPNTTIQEKQNIAKQKQALAQEPQQYQTSATPDIPLPQVWNPTGIPGERTAEVPTAERTTPALAQMLREDALTPEQRVWLLQQKDAREQAQSMQVADSGPASNIPGEPATEINTPTNYRRGGGFAPHDYILHAIEKSAEFAKWSQRKLGDLFQRAVDFVRSGKTYIEFGKDAMKSGLGKSAKFFKQAWDDAGSLVNSLRKPMISSNKVKVIAAIKSIIGGADEAVIKGLRPDIEKFGGSSDVSILWGDSKKGLMHIGQQRGADIVRAVLDTVADGEISKFVPSKKTVHLEKDGVEAVLSLDESGKKKTWLLTGWKINKPDASSEVSARSGATQTGPMFSRSDLGAGLTSNLSPSDTQVKSGSSEIVSPRDPRRGARISVRGLVDAVTGVKSAKDEPTITEKQAEKRALQREKKVADEVSRVAHRGSDIRASIVKSETTRIERERAVERIADLKTKNEQANANRDDLRKQAIELSNTVPLEVRGKIVAAVANANTPAKFAHVVDMLESGMKDVAAQDAMAAYRKEIKGLKKYPNYGMHPEMADQIRSIVDNVSDATPGKTFNKLADWMERNYNVRFPDGSVPVPERIVKALRDAKNENIRDIAKKDPQRLHEMAETIRTFRRLNNDVTWLERNREAKAASVQAHAVSDEVVQRKKEIPHAVDETPQSGWVRRFLGSNMGAENLAMRAGKNGKELFFEGPRRGEEAAARVQFLGKDHMEPVFKKAGLESENKRAKFAKEVVDIPTSHGSMKITRGQKIDLLAHLMDPDTREQILRGGVTSGLDKSGTTHNITREMAERIIAEADPRETQIAHAMVDFIGKVLKPILNEMAVKLTGEEIAHRMVYWPRTVEYSRDPTTGFYSVDVMKTLENMGIFKERVTNNNPVKLTDGINKFENHVSKVAGYTGLAEPIRKARLALGSRIGPDNLTLEKQLMRRYGKDYTDHINRFLEALEEAAHGGDRSLMSGLYGKIFGNVAFADVSLSPTVAAKHFNALPNMLFDATPAEIINALPAMFNVSEYEKKWNENSPLLRSRFEDSTLKLAQTEYAHQRKDWREAAMFMMRDVLKRMAAVSYGIAEGRIDKNDPDYARKVGSLAADIVSHSQNPHSITDRSMLSLSTKRSAIESAAMLFTGPMNVVAKGLDRLNQRRLNGEISSTEAIARGMSVLIGGTIMEQGIAAMYAKATGKQDDKTAIDRIIDGVNHALGSFYGVGTVTNFFTDAYRTLAEGKALRPDEWHIGEAPYLSTMEECGRFLLSGMQALADAHSGIQIKHGPNQGEDRWFKDVLGMLRHAKGPLALGGIPVFPMKLVNDLKHAKPEKTEQEKETAGLRKSAKDFRQSEPVKPKTPAQKRLEEKRNADPLHGMSTKEKEKFFHANPDKRATYQKLKSHKK
ncbi:MAG: hypothetical protein HQM09_15225 [Candidatus Riflebacteria bacterium]|nr:hypothetical protein [Candidatus Riflebacteria bacterium]